MDHSTPDRSLNLFGYWRVVRKRWLWIVGVTFAAVLAAFIVSRLSPKYYESTAVILPFMPDSRGGMGFSLGGDEGGKGRESGEGGGSSSLAGLLGQGVSTADVLKSILNSRTMADSLIEQLNLKAYYGTDSMTATRDTLKSETAISVNREKAFFIKVESRDPQMAADLANAYVSNLDRLNRMLSVTSASRSRLFVERRLEEKKQQLNKAEEARKQFQIENRTLLVTDKAQAAMRAAGSIEDNILELEVELAGLQEYATPAHPLINQMDAQIQALEKQLARLQHKQKVQMGVSSLGDSQKASRSKEFYPPMPDMPILALEYIRLTREVKIHEAIVSMLTGQYEQARISEARDTPTVQVLDPAIPAEFKSRPRTLHNMQVAGLVGLVLVVFFALLVDYVAQLRIEEARRMAGMDMSSADSFMAAIPSDAHLVPGGNGSGTPAGYVERKPESRAV
jgi:uncharacterized protein involved in exopolysaccharide biosynthesis